jgi:hypothetical protein
MNPEETMLDAKGTVNGEYPMNFIHLPGLNRHIVAVRGNAGTSRSQGDDGLFHPVIARRAEGVSGGSCPGSARKASRD